MNVNDIKLIKDVLQLSVTEVVQTLTDLTPRTEPEIPIRPASQVLEAITFTKGFTGVFFIRVDHELAKTFATKILKMPCNQVDDDVVDTVGEILNIIVGKFKAVLTSHNYELFDFSPPIKEVDQVKYQKLSENGVERVLLGFGINQDRFGVEVHFATSVR